MSFRMNRAAYQKLIDEDIEWLLTQPKTLERDHIELILKCQVEERYGHICPRCDLVVQCWDAKTGRCAACDASRVGKGRGESE